MASLFATHPPITERIQAIDPHFRPDSVSPKPAAQPAPRVSTPDKQTIPPSTAFAAAVTASIASPQTKDIASASALIASIPEEITDRLSSPSAAAGVMYGVLLDPNEATRRRQLDILIADGDAPGADIAEQTRRSFQNAGLKLRLPLLQLAIPALTQLPASDQKRVARRANLLARVDNRVAPFEFAVDVLLSAALAAEPVPRAAATSEDLNDEICLLSYLAYAGASNNEARAARAFQKGFEALGSAQNKAVLAWLDCGTEATHAALFRLARAPAAAKQKLVAALGACVTADNTITPDEWELLRAFCQCLGCPTPLNPPDFA
jgi:hypothetical protein